MPLDRITAANMSQFAKQHNIEHYDETAQFEKLSAYCTLSSNYDDILDLEAISTGDGGDCGIDSLSIVVNGAVVTDPDQVQDILDNNKYLDIQFFFIQSTVSQEFNGSKINSFFFGVEDFFRDQPQLPSNEKMENARSIKNELYERAASFKRGNPDVFCYYVTNGSWQAPDHTVAIISAFRDRLSKTNLVDKITVEMIDARRLQELYRLTQNSLKADIILPNVLTLPPIEGVDQSYLGYISAKEYLKLVTDEHGNLVKTVFYDNVRDFQGENKVNSKIVKTLVSADRGQFLIRNNGVTVVAKSMSRTGDKFSLTDFQIVNGCQTSHVLFMKSDEIDDSVSIPIRIVATDSEDITKGVIEATNSQTEVSDEQLRSLSDFQKTLEEHYSTYEGDARLYYERRSKQYAASIDVERTRIVSIPSQIKSFGAMFLEDPHRAGRYFATLRKIHEDKLFQDGDRPEAYYTAAFAAYRLEYLFRNNILHVKYKPVRWHILLAFRVMATKSLGLPPMNSRKMLASCNTLNAKILDADVAAQLFQDAAQLVENAFEGADRPLEKDEVRSQESTEIVTRALREWIE